MDTPPESRELPSELFPIVGAKARHFSGGSLYPNRLARHQIPSYAPIVKKSVCRGARSPEFGLRRNPLASRTVEGVICMDYPTVIRVADNGPPNCVEARYFSDDYDHIFPSFPWSRNPGRFASRASARSHARSVAVHRRTAAEFQFQARRAAGSASRTPKMP